MILTTFFFVFIMPVLFLTEAQSSDICNDQFGKCLKTNCSGKKETLYSNCMSECLKESFKCEEEEEKKHPTPSVIDEIQAKCAKKWPDDYEMQLYCSDKQIKAYIKIFEIKYGLAKEIKD